MFSLQTCNIEAYFLIPFVLGAAATLAPSSSKFCKNKTVTQKYFNFIYFYSTTILYIVVFSLLSSTFSITVF